MNAHPVKPVQYLRVYTVSLKHVKMKGELTLHVENIWDAELHGHSWVAHHTGEGVTKGMAGGRPDIAHLRGGGPIGLILYAHLRMT